MSNGYRAITVAAINLLAIAAMSSTGTVHAADFPAKAVKAVPDLPFFLVIDNRLTYSWMPNGTDPGAFSVRRDGSVNGKTAKQVYSFTHFDAWAYGTNFFNVSMFKSDHNDPAGPCVNAGVLQSGAAASCAGATEVYGLVRSTFGWNQLFNTKAFSIGPLNNISFEIGADVETENTFLAPSKRDFVAGLQFAFDLPYKGYFNVAPLLYKEINHNAFNQCGLFGPGTPGLTCSDDGKTDYKTTWAIETNYSMDLGFLPENMQYFSISGRAAWYGPKGDQNAPLSGTGVGRFSTATKTEFNSEPIRVTFDAAKFAMGPKYTHMVDVWVAYRYWQNKFGLDHNAAPGVCTVAATGQSTKSCTEQTVYTGVSVKF
ncbi:MULTISPECIES: hypothetical protein [Rhodopseudomonas]|uniref:Signal peptide protein n=1 Tax=Rhodopseudomonas palustris TaxID=1076 RepID=A0A0D7F1Y3_RHOPL|nr:MULTISPECIES: hypothetical protein [Rhodopseudomonas]KIZ47123.1 signal peptide protein [Rhodopseudomonas palustris]MDF3811402.1 hypothetical protein [Rhodopseudomonas sp. BAL398]WOK16301.1 hypothetical protein RBJ75_19350 [Rhodopseudomonas sp. BAL398]